MNQYYCKGCNQVVWRQCTEDKLKSWCDIISKDIMLVKVKVEPLASAKDKPVGLKTKPNQPLEKGIRPRKEILSERTRLLKRKSESELELKNKKTATLRKLRILPLIAGFNIKVNTLEWVLRKQKTIK